MHKAFVTYGSMTVKELPLHRNMGMELVYVSEGSLRWIVDGHVETVYPGSVFFTLPWQAHGSADAHEPGNRIHFVQFKLDKLYRRAVAGFGFHPSLAVSDAHAQRVSRLFAGAAKHTWSASPNLSALILMLIEGLERDADALFLQALLQGLIAELAAIVSGEQTDRVPFSPTEQRVETFLVKLRERCDEPWRLEAMAKACAMGRSLFAGTVQRLTGDTPSVHLRRLRVEKAESLLAETDTPITRIAFDCGFTTSELFARTFKEFNNQTPSQYRRAAREQKPTHVIDFTEKDERRRMHVRKRHEWL